EVEQAVEATLRKWLPTYLRYVERKFDRAYGSLKMPRSWNVSAEMSHWPEEMTPALLIVNSGLAAEPTKDGAGLYSAVWAISLVIILSAATRGGVNRLKQHWELALRMVMLQKSGLEGVAQGVRWIDSNYREAPVEVQRSGQAAILH